MRLVGNNRQDLPVLNEEELEKKDKTLDTKWSATKDGEHVRVAKPGRCDSLIG